MLYSAFSSLFEIFLGEGFSSIVSLISILFCIAIVNCLVFAFIHIFHPSSEIKKYLLFSTGLSSLSVSVFYLLDFFLNR